MKVLASEGHVMFPINVTFSGGSPWTVLLYGTVSPSEKSTNERSACYAKLTIKSKYGITKDINNIFTVILTYCSALH